MQTTTRWPVALLLALALGACGGEPEVAEEAPVEDVAREVDQRAMEEVTEASDEPGPGEAPPYVTPEPAPVVPVPNPPAQPTVTGALQPLNASTIRGSLTVAEAGDRTLVTVTITNAPPGVPLQIGIHREPCTPPGARVAPVADFRVSERGLATVTDTLPMAPTAVMSGAHVLLVRLQAGETPGLPVACAPIPRRSPDVVP